MGNWAIVIRGVGVHHNKNLPKDANRLAAGFVELLKEAGHTIEEASFTHGGAEDLNNADSAFGAATPLAIEEPATT